ncbi:hypothetical protein HNR46_004163 [Haloferula luteola]|uniref:Uncharacterized protein n=1 Tax=Haloferula luteola TaxID=595692 RepID=A0A840VH27_9BACT|nr:hypothetical protein [Haloferula luteola]MBB5353898.1 hypothetical protein [Haloferula luteola]
MPDAAADLPAPALRSLEAPLVRVCQAPSFRRISQDVASDADVKKLKSILQELEFECPLFAAP